jgi:drug/metabolite transporter (DMT)-like permease
MGTEPVFGAIFATVWVGESLSVASWVGGLLIVLASLWATMRRAA